MRDRLEAHTQYDDFLGTAAADRGDHDAFSTWLVEHGHMQAEGELLVAVEIVFTEKHGHPVPEPGVVAFIASASSYKDVQALRDSDGPLPLRVVDIRALPIADFFALFKRFDMVLTLPELRSAQFARLQ